jgi:orotidine-5'-phosphate decarboxylase
MDMRREPLGPRIIVALDFSSAKEALELVSLLQPGSCRLKVGKELFTAAGPPLVHELHARGFEVFLDLKFHDIPNTVAAAVRAAAALGVWMLNVHASGGSRMMEAAANALTGCSGPRPLLIAVTVLTSMEAADLGETGIDVPVQQQVLRLASLACNAGLDGLVCSAREAPLLRAELGAGPILVTPGIRPRDSNTANDDQRRVVTPGDALAAGSDYLVIGRPISAAADPAAALARIISEIS